MKRLFSLVIVALLISGVAYAGVPAMPDNPNITYIDYEKEYGEHPQCEVRLVRYSMVAEANAPTLVSGSAVVYDTTSADGITVSACIASNDTIAGILVTPLQTTDNGIIDSAEDNWGYMCVRGYCLAKMEGGSVAGEALVASGFTETNRYGHLSTVNAVNVGVLIGVAAISKDIGQLLQAPSADGDMMPIILGQ